MINLITIERSWNGLIFSFSLHSGRKAEEQVFRSRFIHAAMAYIIRDANLHLKDEMKTDGLNRTAVNDHQQDAVFTGSRRTGSCGAFRE